ncbi:MAG: chemotaxis protein CheW [Phormidesmis sp.]
MAIISPRRFSRTRTQQSEKTQQLIIFEVCQERFALPIKAVFKVVPMGTTYGDPNDVGSSITVYEGRELVVLDVARHVFGRRSIRTSSSASVPSVNVLEPTPMNYLIVARSPQNVFIGLPVAESPTVRRVPLSAFSPLPPSYAGKVNIQCVSSLIIEPEKPPLFLLNTEQLTQLPPQLTVSS